MLLCFGVSWPVDIINTLRLRQSSGKSFAFMTLIGFGYLAGIASKIARASTTHQPLEFVTWFYVANALLVLTDILVSRRYLPRPKTSPLA